MPALIGLISDTHRVFDEELRNCFKGVQLILHAGDVGHNGGEAGVLQRLEQITAVQAVRGNVDNSQTSELPARRLVECLGWRILVQHIVAEPSKEARELHTLYQADICIHGHSHQYAVSEEGPILFINPGSCGPARFKLQRTAALLTLHSKDRGVHPSVHKICLGPKAPARLPKDHTPRHKRQKLQA